MSIGRFESPSPGMTRTTIGEPKVHGNGFLDSDHRIRSSTSSKTRETPIFMSKDKESEYFHQFVHIERHANGGASLVHMYQEEFAHLPPEQAEKLAHVFFQEVFCEKPRGVARHVMGIVHNAAAYLPEMVSYLATNHPDMIIKSGFLRKSEIETVKMEEYAERVEGSYAQGTFRCGPMLQVSLVGQVSEESGGYLPDCLGE